MRPIAPISDPQSSCPSQPINEPQPSSGGEGCRTAQGAPKRRSRSAARCTVAVAALVVVPVAMAPCLAACSKRSAPNATATAGSASGNPLTPSGSGPFSASSAKPYAGPTGTVRGTVRVVGDAPPILDSVLQRIPDQCAGARSMYGALFRKGSAGEAADVLVTVTDYEHSVPPSRDHVTVTARDCAWDTRTVGMAMGQRLDIVAKDAKGYVPDLVGLPSPARIIPIPGGDPVHLRPTRPGRHGLKDLAHGFVYADVFVLNYPTLDVTGADGRFEISGVPVGSATVSALLPAAMLVEQRKVVVKANETLDIDIELNFDDKKYQQQRRQTPTPQPSASTTPASSAR